VNDESRSERFISLLQRSFQSAEADECGYIIADKLQLVRFSIEKNEPNSSHRSKNFPT
jgi:hypothetical protein